MKKISALLITIILVFSSALSSMAQDLLISSVTKEGENWVVKGTWSGNKPLTIEVLKQATIEDENGERNIIWEDIATAEKSEILNYLVYFNQADNKDGNFEFKIANLESEPEVRVYSDGEFFYHSRATLNAINAATDGEFYDSIMDYGFLNDIITYITESLNEEENTEFWNKLFTYKENKASGFVNFGEVVTTSKEIAILTKIMYSDTEVLTSSLELLTPYGIKESNSWNIYTKKGEFSRENYLTAQHKEILVEALKAKAQELNVANDFVEYFNEKVVLVACHNNTTDYLVRDIINKSDMISNEGTGNYSKLTAQQKLKIAGTINSAENEYATVSELAKEISDAAKKANNSESSSSGGGGGGGGGGSITTNKDNNITVVYPEDESSDKEIVKHFSDIDSHKWAEDAIYALREKGIISGTSDTTFEPERGVTREEFVKMLVLATNILNESATAPFEDVSGGAWYAPFVASAYNAKLVNGVTEEAFGIGTQITREQLACMVYRVLSLKGKLSSASQNVNFTDSDSVSDYAKEAVDYITSCGIMNGMGDGSFAPKNTVTRAQAAKVIYELVQIL